MRVEIPASLGVNQSNNVLVSYKGKISFRVIEGLFSVGVEEPIVIGILVMVAGYLLLLGPLGICLHMRMK